jgi:hypothetical protein
VPPLPHATPHPAPGHQLVHRHATEDAVDTIAAEASLSLHQVARAGRYSGWLALRAEGR